MENRPLSLAAKLILLALLSGSALAADSGPSPEQQADWDARLGKAEALHAESKARMEAAEKLLAEKEATCVGKFFVNACHEDNNSAYREASRAARVLENESKAIDLQVKKEQLSDRDRRHAEAEPQRQADLKARQEDKAAASSEDEAKRAAKLAEKERKAAEGAQRKAADAEKYRQKQQAHDARVAEKKQQAELRAAGAKPGQQ